MKFTWFKKLKPAEDKVDPKSKFEEIAEWMLTERDVMNLSEEEFARLMKFRALRAAGYDMRGETARVADNDIKLAEIKLKMAAAMSESRCSSLPARFCL